MIDWDAPDEPPAPDFIKPHLGVEIRTIADAIKLLDQWERAHQEACTAWARAHDAYCKMKWRAEAAETLAFGFESLYVAALDPANDDIRAELKANYKP